MVAVLRKSGKPILPRANRMALFALRTLADLRGALAAIEHLDPDTYHDATSALPELMAVIGDASDYLRRRVARGEA